MTELSPDEFPQWLRRRLEARIATAIVRFGDGEARLLLSDLEDDESMQGTIDEIARETGRAPSVETVAELRAHVAFAFDEADVLGIRPREHFADAHKAQMGRLADLYATRVATGRPPAAVANCMLGHHLREELPDMLAGRRVSVLSCRDLKPVLEGEWGLEDVVVYQVPSQYSMRDVDGPYEAAMHDVPIWPDAHERVRSELTVREPGELFLVGAALFGKDLCIRIREQGGIALDMGSALDRIAGKVTRGPTRRVLDLYARGLQAEEIASRLERNFGMQIDQDWIVDTIASAVQEEIDAWRTGQLKACYQVVFFDTLQADIRVDGRTESHSCQVAIGVCPDGIHERLGIWWDDQSRRPLWPRVFEDLRDRGVRHLSITCADAVREPVSEAVMAVFNDASVVRGVTNPIGSCSSVQATLERYGSFPDRRAATTLIFLALARAEFR